MLKLLWLTLGISFTLAVCVWTARLVGQRQATPVGLARLHLTDCPPPCWLGITPGVTTVMEAKAIITAVYHEQGGLVIKDSGFADGPVFPDRVENDIEGNDFHLYVRLNIVELVDGKREKVQSIGLSQPRADRGRYAPTVADILGTFGPPQGIVVEALTSSGYEITLRYPDWQAIFYTQARRVQFTEYPRLYLGDGGSQTRYSDYRPWKGLGTLKP